MGQTNDEVKETLVVSTPDLQSADAARKKLMNLGKRLWVFVKKNHENGYDVTACNEFGGKLNEQMLVQFRDIVKQKNETEILVDNDIIIYDAVT